MNKLNKTFIANRILTASELNAITSKIDEIITNWPSSTNPEDPTSGVTELDIIDRVNAAKSELQNLIDSLNASVATVLLKIKDLEDGTHTVDTDEEFLKLLKQQCNAVLIDLQLAKRIIVDGEEIVVPAIDLGVFLTLTNDVNNLKISYAGLSVLPNQVGLIANHFDEDGNPIYNGAQIIASINDEGDSTVGINADKVLIGGDTTLTGKLTALSADIANINVSNTANIANAVVEYCQTNDLYVTGTLRYNKLIGNVTNAIGETILDDGAYFVDIAAPTSDETAVKLQFPENPSVGLTIYINNFNDIIKVKSSNEIIIYVLTTGYDTVTVDPYHITTNQWIDISDKVCSPGVIHFIFDGAKWVQLLHNFPTYSDTRS